MSDDAGTDDDALRMRVRELSKALDRLLADFQEIAEELKARKAAA